MSIYNISSLQVVKNVTGRAAATTEGLTLAYVSLFLMAVVPIFWGSFRSITYHRKSKVGFISTHHNFITISFSFDRKSVTFKFISCNRLILRLVSVNNNVCKTVFR